MHETGSLGGGGGGGESRFVVGVHKENPTDFKASAAGESRWVGGWQTRREERNCSAAFSLFQSSSSKMDLAALRTAVQTVW